MRVAPLTCASLLALMGSAAAQTVAAVTPTGLNPPLRAVTPEWQRPIAVGPEGLTLIGEAASKTLPLYVTATEAVRPARLQLAVASAVSVMPETSRLIVRINGIALGERPTGAHSRPETLTFDIPPGVIQPGYNSIRVSTRQSHRVDCSAGATYELWTKILPGQSGITFRGLAPEMREIGDLAAVKPTQQGTVRIRARVPAGLDQTSLARLARALQSISVVARSARPVVEFDTEESTEPGIDVVIGTTAVVETIAGARPAGAGPRVLVAHNPRTDLFTVTITGETGEDVEAAVAQLAERAMQPPAGAGEGVLALANLNGHPVNGGERLSIKTLGLETQSFPGRLLQQTVRVMLPADFIPGQYDHATIMIDAAYAGGLDQGSRLLLRVNGAPTASLSLAKPGGDVLRRRQLRLPLSAFKAGANTVTFEVESPTRADAACDPGVLMSQAERFRLYDTTEIAFPRLARMGSMPSLSMVPAGGLSAIAGSSPLTVFVPQGKPASLQASLTLLSNIAGISGRVAPTTFTFTQPASGTHVLAIGTLAEMPEDTLTAAGLEPGAMRAGWTGPSGARPAVSQGPVVRMAAAPGAALPSPLPGSSTPAVTPPPLPTPPLLEAATKAREVWQRAFDWTSRQIEQTPDGRDAFQISAATSLVVAQKPALPISREAWHDFLPPLGTNGSTTVVVAPDHDKLLTTISDVFVGSFWEQFVGQAVAYDGEAERVVSRVGPPLGLVETVSPSLGNYRLVFASWLSHRRDLYIGGVLTLALVLAGLTLGLVRRMGVRER